MRLWLWSFIIIPTLCFAQNFPREWWKEVPRSEAASWEILPQDAKDGEVILSKRTELGIFSNFSATPFILDGEPFASIEGLWQSLKYPDPLDQNDPRHQIAEWPYQRHEVAGMIGHEAKAAGDATKKIYAKYNLKNISWMGVSFEYLDQGEGSLYHYLLILRATRAKLDQNPALWKLLRQTECLKLLPDHMASPNETQAYRYYEIYINLRNEVLDQPCTTEQ